jgi:hypothetical protein
LINAGTLFPAPASLPGPQGGRPGRTAPSPFSTGVFGGKQIPRTGPNPGVQGPTLGKQPGKSSFRFSAFFRRISRAKPRPTGGGTIPDPWLWKGRLPGPPGTRDLPPFHPFPRFSMGGGCGVFPAAAMGDGGAKERDPVTVINWRKRRLEAMGTGPFLPGSRPPWFRPLEW